MKEEECREARTGRANQEWRGGGAEQEERRGREREREREGGGGGDCIINPQSKSMFPACTGGAEVMHEASQVGHQ